MTGENSVEAHDEPTQLCVPIPRSRVSKLWPLLRTGVLPPIEAGMGGNERIELSVLDAVQSGRATVWVIYNMESKKIGGFALTTVTVDGIVGLRNLLIYSVFGPSSLPTESWQLLLSTLQDYARLHNMDQIVTYPTNPAALDLARRLGADTGTTLAVWRIE